MEDFLKEEFAVPTVKNVKKRKRALQDEPVLQQVAAVTTDPGPGVAAAAYETLLQDWRHEHQKGQVLQDRNDALLSEVKILKNNIRDLQETVDELKGRCRCPNAARQSEIERQKNRVQFWKKRGIENVKNEREKVAREKEGLKEQKKMVNKDVEVKRLRSCLSSQKYRIASKNKAVKQGSIHAKCKADSQMLKMRIFSLENELAEAQEEVEAWKKAEEESKVIQTREGGRYSANMRMAVYQALQRQCPVDHVGATIQKVVSELTGKEVSNAPSSSTVCRMAREMTTVADLQAAEQLLRSDHSAIAWDATELKGAHINEVHVITKDPESGRKYFTLGLAQLPGGTTKDYVEHIKVLIFQTYIFFFALHRNILSGEHRLHC